MYLAVSNCVVNVVLFFHKWDREQRLIYYVSKAIVDVETRYSQVEQTALILKNVTWKLCPHFQAHQVTILTNQPFQVTLYKSNLSGRMLKWAIELSEYGIKYQLWLSLKGQVMANFIVELPKKQTHSANRPGEQWWTLYPNTRSRCDPTVTN